MKWILIVLGALVALVALVALAGATVPRDHVASARASFTQKPDAIYAAITTFADFPKWRDDVKSVEILPPVDGKIAYREETRSGKVTYRIEVADPPRRLVGRIGDDDLPYGGTWTWEIEPRGAGSVVTITERGEIKSLIFRAVARYVFGYHATMMDYLRALGRKFGEDVVPEKVAAG